MINLNLVSFVGIDQSSELDIFGSGVLKEFQESNIKYEFGILYSDSKNGKDKRYPTHDFSKKYLEWAKNNNVHSSLHLCGSSIDRYLSEDSEVIDLCVNAGRIQLNLNIKKYLDYQALSDNILYIATKYNHKIILQNNKTKAIFNKVFLASNPKISLSLLNDSSGGFGREISNVLEPDKTYFTGYAGGINTTNVINIIKLIEAVNISKTPYYIDMESGIRENNIFSIKECLKIKELVELQNLE